MAASSLDRGFASMVAGAAAVAVPWRWHLAVAAGSVPGVALRFRVLGPVEAVDADGRPLALPGERQRLLLAALLARAGEVVSADRLAQLLWGDDQPADPPAALHSQVARLRRALRQGGADGLLETRPPGYRLAADRDQVDAGRFEHLAARAAAAPPAEAVRLLEEALALWRGTAYAGQADTEPAQLEAIRLEEARQAAVERLAEALVARGRAAALAAPPRARRAPGPRPGWPGCGSATCRDPTGPRSPGGPPGTGRAWSRCPAGSPASRSWPRAATPARRCWTGWPPPAPWCCTTAAAPA
jgi:DNA-binding winged helix-turn-helix (wHTH) protein